MRVGTVLKAMRISAFPGASLKTFSRAIGIPERSIGALEAGWRFPSVSALTPYFALDGPEGDTIRALEPMLHAAFNKELLLRRVIVDEPWFTAAHALAGAVLKAICRHLLRNGPLSADRLGRFVDEPPEMQALKPADRYLITALSLREESRDKPHDPQGIPCTGTESAPTSDWYYALVVAYLLNDARFMALADTPSVQIDSPFPEKWIRHERVTVLNSLPSLLERPLVPDIFATMDLLLLTDLRPCFFNLAEPGRMTVGIRLVSDGAVMLRRLTSQVTGPAGSVQPYARTPWRPAPINFEVRVLEE